MATLADRAAAAHEASWCQIHALWGRGWLEVHAGFMASFSELAVPSFNGASLYGPCVADELAAAVAKLRDSGLPYHLQCRPEVHAQAEELADQLGLEPVPHPVPLMLTQQAPPAREIAGLHVRRLAPAENGIHAAILAEAFAAPLELSVELTPSELLVPQNVWTLVGEFHGRPVTTAFVDLHDGVGQIHNVGTREAFRGRGFGAAITATATRIAFDAGADLAMLLSSPMAIGVYESVGFHRVEHWSVWETPVPLVGWDSAVG